MNKITVGADIIRPYPVFIQQSAVRYDRQRRADGIRPYNSTESFMF